MKLTVYDSHTYVEGHVKDIHTLKKILSVRPPGYYFTKKYQMGWWDGYISLYDKKKDRFPTGLLDFVTSSISKYGINDYEIVQNTYRPGAYDLVIELNGLVLRNYQIEAVNSVLKHRRGILHMATNAGKTAVCASIIKSTSQNAVIIVPNRSLLLQTSKDLKNLLGMEIGVFGSGHKDFKDVNVTTMQSMHHLLKNDLSDNEIVIIDECHHTQANTLYKHVYDIPGSFRIGMSGTPLKYDVLSDMKLIGATGPILYYISNKSLIEDGYSSDVAVQFYEVDYLDEGLDPEEAYDLPYQDAYRTCIVENDSRNEVIADICDKCDGPVLIMVNWIDHADCIYQHLDIEDSLVITGINSNEEIEEAMTNLGVTYNVLVATSIFKEGINIPSIEHLIIASGGKGHIQLLQRIGRGLRKSEGKDILHIYDFIDDTNKYLIRHSLERLKIYEAEGFNVELVRN